MNILLDFDGTILDASNRMYLLFQHLVPESTIVKQEYWEYKRNKVSHRDILHTKFKWDEDRIGIFTQSWLSLIESDYWLSLDTLDDEIKMHLEYLGTSANLYLVTARQSRAKLVNQLETLLIRRVFKEVFVTEHMFTKYDLVRHLPLSRNDWFVGDTGHDIATGKQLRIRTCAVSNGFLSRVVLVGYNPDFVCDSLAKFDPDHAIK
jgi:phosphoglycolate phosphatase